MVAARGDGIEPVPLEEVAGEKSSFPWTIPGCRRPGWLEPVLESNMAGEYSESDPHCIADVGDAQVDIDRLHRCGFPEVIFAEGKSVEAIEKIFRALLHHGADVLATRMSPEQAAALSAKFPAGRYNAVARTFRISRENIHEGHEGHEEGRDKEGKERN